MPGVPRLGSPCAASTATARELLAPCSRASALDRSHCRPLPRRSVRDARPCWRHVQAPLCRGLRTQLFLLAARLEQCSAAHRPFHADTGTRLGLQHQDPHWRLAHRLLVLRAHPRFHGRPRGFKASPQGNLEGRLRPHPTPSLFRQRGRRPDLVSMVHLSRRHRRSPPPVGLVSLRRGSASGSAGRPFLDILSASTSS